MKKNSSRSAFVGAALFNWSETQRMLTIARGLQARGWEIMFAGDGPYARLLAGAGFRRVFLKNDPMWFSAERIRKMMDMGRYGGRLGSPEELSAVVEEETGLIRALSPDCVITGYRMTLTASARIAGVPLIWCMSAVMSEPFLRKTAERAKVQLASRREGADRAIRQGAFEDSYACGRLLGHQRQTTEEWNRLLLSNGCTPLDHDLALYSGDLTLMADAREFFPDTEENDRWQFIGPIFNDEPYEMPPVDDSKENILVTAGSSCTKEHFLHMIRAARTLEGELYVTGADILSKDEMEMQPPDIHFYEKLPLYEMAKHCRMAVVHGGQGTIYNILRAGCPMAAFPETFEQRHNIENMTAKCGCGRVLAGGKRTVAEMADVMRDVFAGSGYRKNALKAASVLKKYDREGSRESDNAADRIEAFLNGRN